MYSESMVAISKGVHFYGYKQPNVLITLEGARTPQPLPATVYFLLTMLVGKLQVIQEATSLQHLQWRA